MYMLSPYVSQLELTKEEKDISQEKRRGALKAKCEHGLTVNASSLIDTMESSIKYTQPDYFK